DAVEQHEPGGLALGLLVVAADEIDAAGHVAVRIDLEGTVVLNGLHGHTLRRVKPGALSQSVKFEVTSFSFARRSNSSRPLPAGMRRASSRAFSADACKRSWSDCVCFVRLRLVVIAFHGRVRKYRSLARAGGRRRSRREAGLGRPNREGSFAA